jgi:hypothetical protein
MKVCPITGVEWTEGVLALLEEWMQEEIAALVLEGGDSGCCPGLISTARCLLPARLQACARGKLRCKDAPVVRLDPPLDGVRQSAARRPNRTKRSKVP